MLRAPRQRLISAFHGGAHRLGLGLGLGLGLALALALALGLGLALALGLGLAPTPTPTPTPTLTPTPTPTPNHSCQGSKERMHRVFAGACNAATYARVPELADCQARMVTDCSSVSANSSTAHCRSSASLATESTRTPTLT